MTLDLTLTQMPPHIEIHEMLQKRMLLKTAHN